MCEHINVWLHMGWGNNVLLGVLLSHPCWIKAELKQSFCSRMPFLLPTSRNHSLDLMFSLTTKTPEQGRGVTPFMLSLRCQYPRRVGWDGTQVHLGKMDIKMVSVCVCFVAPFSACNNRNCWRHPMTQVSFFVDYWVDNNVTLWPALLM